MKPASKIQTAFRFDPGLLDRMKRAAKKENKSHNAFVEDIMEEKVGREIVFPKIPKDFKASEEALSYAVDCKLDPRYEGLSASEQAALDKVIKYERLKEKYG